VNPSAWALVIAAGGSTAPAPEPPQHSTPAIPTADLTEETRPRAAGSGEILFINFDGAVLQTGCGNDPHYDCSTLAGLFDGYVGPFGGNYATRVNILQETRRDLADFDVTTVIERPPDDVDYTMVFYGDLGDQTFAGIAPYIDCEDGRGSDVSFTQGFVNGGTGSTVILQEAAHTWGLEHIDAPFDILNPFATNSQSFQDECFKIVANTDLESTSGSCNQIHQQFCETGWQNSYREMLLLFGPSSPDVEAPTLTITSPEDGSTHVLPTTIALLGEVTDNLDPQYYGVKIWDGDTMIFDEQQVGLDLLLLNPPEGDYALRVELTDTAQNVTEASVEFTVLPEGSELPPTDDDEVDDEPESVGACAVRPLGGPLLPRLGMLALVVLAATRRRSARDLRPRRC